MKVKRRTDPDVLDAWNKKVTVRVWAWREARAVGAEDRDPVAALDEQVDVAEERRAAVAVAHALDGDDLLAGARRGREAEAELLLVHVRPRHVLGAALEHLLELPLLLARRHGLALDGAQLGDLVLERADVLLLPLVAG